MVVSNGIIWLLILVVGTYAELSHKAQLDFKDSTSQCTSPCLRECYFDQHYSYTVNITRPPDGDFVSKDSTASFELSKDSKAPASEYMCSCSDIMLYGTGKYEFKTVTDASVTGEEWLSEQQLLSTKTTFSATAWVSNATSAEMSLMITVQGVGDVPAWQCVAIFGVRPSGFVSYLVPPETTPSPATSPEPPLFTTLATVVFDSMDASSDQACVDGTDAALACFGGCFWSASVATTITNTRLRGELSFADRSSTATISTNAKPKGCVCFDVTTWGGMENFFHNPTDDTGSRLWPVVGVVVNESEGLNEFKVQKLWYKADFNESEGAYIQGSERIHIEILKGETSCTAAYRLTAGTFLGTSIAPTVVPAAPNLVANVTAQSSSIVAAATTASIAATSIALPLTRPSSIECEARLERGAVSGGEQCTSSDSTYSCFLGCLATLCASELGGTRILHPLSQPPGCTCTPATASNITAGTMSGSFGPGPAFAISVKNASCVVLRVKFGPGPGELLCQQRRSNSHLGRGDLAPLLTGQRRAASELVVELLVVEGQLLGAKFGAGASLEVQDGAAAQVAARLAVAEVAALGVTGVVASMVAAVTLASLGAAVAASTSGAATAAAVSGGAAGGGGLVSLVSQAQFISVAGRVGGRQKQTASTAALSDGLAWTNGHIVAFNMTGVCPAMQGVPQELAGTVTTCVIAMAITGVVRLAVTAVIKYAAKRRGREAPELPMLLWPAWELAVATVAFQGLAESTGVALASGCKEYVIAGAFTMVLLVVFLGWCARVLHLGVVRRLTEFEASDTSATMDELRELWRGGGAKGGRVVRLRAYYTALSHARERGEWRDAGGIEDRGRWTNNFADRYGAIFAEYHGRAWGYGMWLSLRKLLVCVLIALVPAQAENGGMALGFFALEAVILAVLFPSVDRVSGWVELGVAVARVVQLAGVEAFLLGVMQAPQFDLWFLVASLVGIIPLMIQSVCGTLASIANNCSVLVAVRGELKRVPDLREALSLTNLPIVLEEGDAANLRTALSMAGGAMDAQGVAEQGMQGSFEAEEGREGGPKGRHGLVAAELAAGILGEAAGPTEGVVERRKGSGYALEVTSPTRRPSQVRGSPGGGDASSVASPVVVPYRRGGTDTPLTHRHPRARGQAVHVTYPELDVEMSPATSPSEGMGCVPGFVGTPGRSSLGTPKAKMAGIYMSP